MKRAKRHCELCGNDGEIKALEVDHIIPRNMGGTDDLSNLQALCYSCNAMKRDRDDTDFRAVNESFKIKDAECTFCNLSPESIVDENPLAVVIRDKFPVTPLHTLIIPKRHISNYFDLGSSEVSACNRLLEAAKHTLSEKDPTIDGFNIGINVGETAGQTFLHCHIHLIPRRRGDVNKPRGGVRHTVPGRGYY